MICRSQTPPEGLGHRPASTLWESRGSLHSLLLSIITSSFMLELFPSHACHNEAKLCRDS